MEEIVKVNNEDDIGNMIYEIRGQQVMLDSDLAKLYQVKTKALIQSVKRNIERFPENFMFQLTDAEYDSLRSQNVTSNGRGGRRYSPYVFTEQGVAMLSGVLNSETAINVSVQIMNASIAMRKYISTNLLEQKYINRLALEDHDRINLIESSLKKFEEKQETSAIFFNGQIYDAYSKIYDIFKEAKRSLVIIDSYSDNTTLNIIKKLKVPVIIITSNKAPLSSQDIKKYSAQYNNLTVIRNNTFHDRYFILDNEIVYHCGASINYIGKRTFSITRISDESVTELLLDKVDEIVAGHR